MITSKSLAGLYKLWNNISRDKKKPHRTRSFIWVSYKSYCVSDGSWCDEVADRNVMKGRTNSELADVTTRRNDGTRPEKNLKT